MTISAHNKDNFSSIREVIFLFVKMYNWMKEVIMVRELIGQCETCGKNIYCENGFFDGVHEDGSSLCNSCAEELKEK
ncbi:hypothetical protein ACFQ3N_11800 [Virgibacillus byunsanensis]|uniref:GapA-binding peptide SR1P n=1 Tax=Virgibacillus byunsanensis TaxID=570945 RepID=A0ABW3LN13_9BACI